MSSRRARGGPRSGPRAPKTAPRAAQSAPRGAQDHPGAPQERIQGAQAVQTLPGSPSGAHFGLILGPFWVLKEGGSHTLLALNDPKRRPKTTSRPPRTARRPSKTPPICPKRHPRPREIFQNDQNQLGPKRRPRRERGKINKSLQNILDKDLEITGRDLLSPDFVCIGFPKIIFTKPAWLPSSV